jgi:hypothetical protein
MIRKDHKRDDNSSQSDDSRQIKHVNPATNIIPMMISAYRDRGGQIRLQDDQPNYKRAKPISGNTPFGNDLMRFGSS